MAHVQIIAIGAPFHDGCNIAMPRCLPADPDFAGEVEPVPDELLVDYEAYQAGFLVDDELDAVRYDWD